MNEAVIVAACRTPIGRFGGAFADVGAVQLGATVIAEALRRGKVPAAEVDEVLMGNVLSAGLGQNPARQAALAAGLPVSVPATTVNKVCGSGLKAVVFAAQSIQAGQADIVIAGGMENMSRAPYVVDKARFGYRMGNGELIDSLVQDGLRCAIGCHHMGIVAENIAEEWDISREASDRFSAESHQKAVRAMAEGRFDAEITPVEIAQRKGPATVVSTDEQPRADTTAEKLGTLNPAFKPGGRVTAGNASGICDGAAALVVMSRQKADDLGITPLARVRGYASAGVEPRVMGIGPVPATRKALARTGLALDDVELVELNEAFAAQSLAVLKDLELDPTRVNVNGGAVALGHPIGASGARILVTLLHEMARRDVRMGLASLCIGGGQGISMIVERVQS